MTYCLGIVTHQGLVMASDSRTNAGYDQVNVCRKMHPFVREGERVFVVLTSGSLSVTQSVITLVRRVSDLDRAALERDDFRFNINLLLGGQIGNEPPNLYLIDPQGNPLAAT